MKITIYSTNNCPYCLAAKRLLKHNDMPFEDVDLSTDPALRIQISEKAGGYRSVPMIFIDDSFIGGFQELEAMERAGQLIK